MAGEETRQLIRRHQQVDRGNHKQQDAKQGQNQLHGEILLESSEAMEANGMTQGAANGKPWSACAFLTGGRRTVARPAGANGELLLPVLGQVLLAEVPVLPKLQGRQQHHEPAEA